MGAFWQSWHNYKNPQKSLNILYAGYCLPPYNSISLVSNFYFSGFLSIFSLGKHINIFLRWKYFKSLTWYFKFEKNPIKNDLTIPKSDPRKMCSKWAFFKRFWTCFWYVSSIWWSKSCFLLFQIFFFSIFDSLPCHKKSESCPPSNKAGDNTPCDLFSSQGRNY